jgi:hypothetical protein
MMPQANGYSGQHRPQAGRDAYLDSMGLIAGRQRAGVYGAGAQQWVARQEELYKQQQQQQKQQRQALPQQQQQAQMPVRQQHAREYEPFKDLSVSDFALHLHAS